MVKLFRPRGAGTHSNGHCRRFSLHSLFIPIRGSCYAECGRRTFAVQIYEKIRTRNRRSENKQLAGRLSASGGGKCGGKYCGFRTPRSPPQWFAGGQRTPPRPSTKSAPGGRTAAPRTAPRSGPTRCDTLPRAVPFDASYPHTPRPPNPTGRRLPYKFGADPCDGPKSSAAAMRSPSRDRRGTEPSRCRSEDA